MGRKPCCLKEGVNRGAWSLQEDEILTNYIELHGEGKWRSLPQKAGLNRCGKSCRLRWMNYLRPGIKRGNISPDEEDLILRLHRLLGNRWSLIAGRLPGRTDNEIKNYWNSVLSKKLNCEVSKASNKQCECEGTEPKSVNKCRSGSSSPNVIVPKATRCNKILISVDKGKQLMNEQCCPPSSTPADHFDDEEFMSESKTDNEFQLPNALDYLDLSHTWIEDMFENSNMLESELAPMSLLGLEEEWRDLF